jgi:CO dehydrogenase maturation factor
LRTRPLKVAVAGKGGSGKTALATLLARALAERGLLVLAVDLDANPGLALSLGLPPADSPLPDEAVEEQPGLPYGWGLARHLTAAEAVRRYAVPVGPRVFFMGFGNNAGVDVRVTRHLTAVRQVASDFNEEGWVVIADLSSGPTDAFEGYARFADLTLVVTEPTVTSVLTAERLLEILAHDGSPAEVIATKVRDADDLAVITRALLPSDCIPFDPELRRLEREGSLAQLEPSSPAFDAVRNLAGRMAERELALAPDGATVHRLPVPMRRAT